MTISASSHAVNRTVSGEGPLGQIARVRDALGLGLELEDEVIAASLDEVRRASDPLRRLQAALDSTLGHWLALTRPDVADALSTIVDAVEA